MLDIDNLQHGLYRAPEIIRSDFGVIGDFDAPAISRKHVARHTKELRNSLRRFKAELKEYKKAEAAVDRILAKTKKTTKGETKP